MSQTSLFHWQDQYQKALPRTDRFVWKITGAGTNALIIAQSAALSTYAALTQDQIDAFFGSEDEVLAADYDSTAMGADAQGILLNYNGQVQALVEVVARCYSATGGSTLVTRQTQALGLTASTLETAAELTALGNVAIKIDWGNTPDFDALTTGTIDVEVIWVSK
jgi:hypothetical protein